MKINQINYQQLYLVSYNPSPSLYPNDYPSSKSTFEEPFSEEMIAPSYPNLLNSSDPSVVPPEDLPVPPPDSEIPPFFVIKVLPNDTLTSLSFQYELTIEEIRQANPQISKFFGKTQPLVFNELRIPTHGKIPALRELPETSPSSLIKKLSVNAKISFEEAKFYLIENDFSYELALKQAQEDLIWEQECSSAKSLSQSSISISTSQSIPKKRKSLISRAWSLLH